MKQKIKDMKGDLETLQVSFMDIGNVTMVSVFVENSQIQKAVDLQRHELRNATKLRCLPSSHTSYMWRTEQTVRAVDIGS